MNISSVSALFREPLYAVYTGTKAFVDNFSFSLHYEYASSGIRVQSQIPALVVSIFFFFLKNWFEFNILKNYVIIYFYYIFLFSILDIQIEQG